MTRIILASQSEARKNIISALNIPFEIMPAEIDEKAIRDNNLATRAEKIAIAKAEKISKETTNTIIISADTFCVHKNGEILEKPETLEEAKVMLQLQSGSMDYVYTGFSYIDNQKGFRYSSSTLTKIYLRSFSEEEIDIYIKNMPVLTWSGAFYPGLPYGTAMISKVEGSLSAFLYGLPTEMLIPQLKKSGIGISVK